MSRHTDREQRASGVEAPGERPRVRAREVEQRRTETAVSVLWTDSVLRHDDAHTRLVVIDHRYVNGVGSPMPHRVGDTFLGNQADVLDHRRRERWLKGIERDGEGSKPRPQIDGLLDGGG